HDVVRRPIMARHARRRWVALLAAVAFVAGEVPLGAQGEPSIARVGIAGNLRVEEDAIRVHLRSQPGQPFDQDTIDRDIRAVYAMGFFDQVDADVTRLPENRVEVVYKVEEHEPVKVVEVGFEGNKAFSPRKLRGVMQTREKWLFGFITGAGVLNKEVLRTDVERLTAWYYDHGYVTVRVDEPRVERRDDGLHVTFKVDEGDQFRVGEVRLEGKDLPPNAAKLQEGLAVTPGEVFKAGALRDDVQKLTERLSEDGYAFATVEPETAVRADDKLVDITFQVDRGRPVIVDRIEVSGNTKTRAQVIRREMRLQEQELCSA